MSHPGHALTIRKGPPVPIRQEAGWAPDAEARGNILCPCWGSNSDCPVHSRYRLNELPWLMLFVYISHKYFSLQLHKFVAARKLCSQRTEPSDHINDAPY
jgi:hypothetical protein